jgi:hypothetical protein
MPASLTLPEFIVLITGLFGEKQLLALKYLKRKVYQRHNSYSYACYYKQILTLDLNIV